MSRHLTDDELEERARLFRRKVGLEHQPLIDLMTVIQKLKSLYPGFNYQRVPDWQLTDAEAQWDANTQTIRMRESIFQGMQAQHSRAKMTVAHELSHFELSHSGIRNRSLVKTAAETFASNVRREENEARRLAPRILAPAYLVSVEDTIDDICRRFGLSVEAAGIRREEVDRVQRLAVGRRRELPSVVVDFLKEARRRGQIVRTDIGD